MSEPTFLSRFPVCGCGNMQEAHDAALRACCQMAEHDCLSWYAAVVVAHVNILSYIAAARPKIDIVGEAFRELIDAIPDDDMIQLHRQISAALAKATSGAMN